MILPLLVHNFKGFPGIRGLNIVAGLTLFEISPCAILFVRLDCCSWIVRIICSRSGEVNLIPAIFYACVIAFSVIAQEMSSPNAYPEVKAPSAAMVVVFARKFRLVCSVFGIS